LKWTAGVLGCVLVASGIGGYLFYRQLNSNIQAIDVGNAGNKNVTTSSEAVNILVIGTDSRQGLGGKYGDAGSVGHADTTILFHVSKDRTNATAMSIPRDLVLDIPDCPTKQKDGSVKTIRGTPVRTSSPRFNESLGQEGRDPGCTMRTVTQLTGIPIDHFIMVNFDAVKTISTAIGGVDVCLDHAIDDTTSTGEGSHLHLPAGPAHIQGEQALAFVRTRHSLKNESDLSRIALQQQFMSAMIRKVKSNGTLTSPSKLFKLANAATKALTVDTAIGSGTKLASLAKDLSAVDSKHITFLTLPVIDNPAELPRHITVVPDPVNAPQIYSMVKNDDSLTDLPKKKSAADAKLQGVKADPSEVRVDVFNGGGPAGSAKKTVEWLQNKEAVSHSTNSGNASGGIQKTTTLVYSPDQAAQARALAAVMGLPGAALRPTTAQAAPEDTMTLTLGQDFVSPGTPIRVTPKAPDHVQRTQADKNICVK
jgi:LCP family protein required for cell wall assembly